MQVHYFDAEPEYLENALLACMAAGLAVTCSDSLSLSGIYLRRGLADVLVVHKRSAGPSVDDLFRVAERHAPGLATVLLTDTVSWDLDRFSQLYPSLHAVLEDDVAPQVVAALVQSLHHRFVGAFVAEQAPSPRRFVPGDPPVFHSRRDAVPLLSTAA